MIKRDSANQNNPVVVVTPGSKASIFLKPSDRVVSGERKSITNSGSSKISEIEFKYPQGKDGDSDSDIGGDKPDLSDIEIVLPPKAIYKNGALYWEYEIYVKNTSSMPQSVNWVDAQFGEI